MTQMKKNGKTSRDEKKTETLKERDSKLANDREKQRGKERERARKRDGEFDLHLYTIR